MGGSFPSFDVVLTSLSTAGNMAKGFMALKSEGERQQLVIDLQKKILEAQQQALDARHFADDVYKDYEEAERLLALHLDQSKIVATMKRRGEMLFLPDDPDPSCRRCAEVDVKVIHLSKTAQLVMRHYVYNCPKCGSNFINWPTDDAAAAPQ